MKKRKEKLVRQKSNKQNRGVYIKADLYERLKSISDYTYRSVSNVVRICLENHLPILEQEIKNDPKKTK